MSDFYTIYEFVKHKHIKTYEDAKKILHQYLRIVQLQVEKGKLDDSELFIGEANQWFQIYQDKENDRIWELYYKNDHYIDDYDHGEEEKYGLDN